jgi:hypothetical protein
MQDSIKLMCETKTVQSNNLLLISFFLEHAGELCIISLIEEEKYKNKNTVLLLISIDLFFSSQLF